MNIKSKKYKSYKYALKVVCITGGGKCEPCCTTNPLNIRLSAVSYFTTTVPI